MLTQIKLLTRIGLCNVFGINEARYTRDSSKKQRFALLSVVWIFLVVLLMFYMVLLSTAYIRIGLADVLPMYFYTAAGLVILFFSLLKAGSMMFSLRSFEMQAALPVSTAAIVISRFLTMYASNLLFSLAVMVPGIVIYGWILKPALSFYIYSILGIPFLPMLPLCIALAIGAAATSIGARMRHKSLGIALLSLSFSLVIILASMGLSRDVKQMGTADFKNIAQMMTEMLQKLYPPAWVYGKAVIEGRFLWILGLCAAVFAFFVCVVFVLQKDFLVVCSLLNATYAKNNYKLGKQKGSSKLKALWQRELRRYFASSIYVSNTFISYILMVIASAGLLFTGSDTMEQIIGMPGLVSRLWPLALGFIASMMPVTSCSISMEGKTLWRLQSLPLRPKDVYDGKILLNLSLAAPFYVVSVILSALALRPAPMDLVFLILVPAFYIVFSTVAGLAVNISLPLLQWENETQVVKQSGTTLVSMLIAVGVAAVPSGILLAFPKISLAAAFLSLMVILGIMTTLLYVKIQKREMDF